MQTISKFVRRKKMGTDSFLEKERNVSHTLRDIDGKVEQDRQRLSKIGGLKKRFAIVRLWPDQAVAEHENVERFKKAAELLGIEIVEVDKYGRILSSPGAWIDKDYVDFVLHLHFETPKTYDVFSVAAMWNPIQFYFDWGFDVYWPNQMSHDCFVTTGSSLIKAYIERERGKNFPFRNVTLNHTLSYPVYDVVPRQSIKIFYCGINWEKINGKKGRHDDVLKILDDENLINIYGPEKVQNVAVWADYKNYKGSIPFDGKTVIEKLAQSGACLVFSSDAHKKSSIMSNRLFEALAAGCVVIGDDHPFIPEAIGDNYIKIPSDCSDQERANLIIKAIKDLEENPKKYLEMAGRAQDVFVKKYLLSSQIVDVYEAVSLEKEKLQSIASHVSSRKIDIVIQALDQTAEDFDIYFSKLISSVGDIASFTIIIQSEYFSWCERKYGGKANVVRLPYKSTCILTPIEAYTLCSGYLHNPKVWFLFGVEEVFSNSILAAISSFPTSPVIRLSHILEHADENQNLCFDYRSGSMSPDQFHRAALAACIFDKNWLDACAHLNGVCWKELLKIAEFQESGIEFFQITSLRINIKKYEAYLGRGITYNVFPESNMLSFSTSAQKTFEYNGALKLNYVSRPEEYSINQNEMLLTNFDQNSSLSKILISGWARAEQTFVWSLGLKSTMRIKAPSATKRISLLLTSNPHVDKKRQEVTVVVNGVFQNLFSVDGGKKQAIYIDCSKDSWKVDAVNIIELQIDKSAVPDGGKVDPRNLGVCLWSIAAEG